MVENVCARVAARGVIPLNDDRCFDSDPEVRRIARSLYAGTRELPIVSPHGHVEARLLAENAPFPEPTSLIVTPDHYVLRMLYARGVPLEELGVARLDAPARQVDPRAAWKLFATNYHVFRGTPTGLWLDYQLHELFGIREPLSADTATRAYDTIVEQLASPEFRPRALFERFRIEVLATTDAATDSLEYHDAIRRSGWKSGGRVIPTFRPDALFRIAAPEWRDRLGALESVHGAPIQSSTELVRALEQRRGVFRRAGATATDHAVVEPYTERLAEDQAEALFARAVVGQATAVDERRYQAHLLMEMARLSTSDGLVMQLHAGAFRDHNEPLRQRFGADRGGDIPVMTEFTRNLRPLLNAYGNDPSFRIIIYTLDESTYSRELAPLAGHYPAVRLGAPWWFHDSLEGMHRYRERTTESAGLDRTAGFVDDTRAFCSIPARHDLARRVDANWLARLAARHVISTIDAAQMARAAAYELPRESYRL